MNEDKRPRPADVGLKDRVYEGWLNEETGELTEGVVIEPEHTVVDIGCGDGSYVAFAAKRGAEVIFADRDKDKIWATEQRVRAASPRAFQAHVSDCSPIPVADNSADLVICTEVLEHVPDPQVFLRELIRIARPGGRLLLTVPDARSEQMVAATAPDLYFMEPNHIRIFDADQFQALVLGEGLSIESHRFLGCFWSVYWPLSWLTHVPGEPLPIDNPHPITDHWTRLWQAVQEHPEGAKIRDAFNSVMPKAQCIVATKPG